MIEMSLVRTLARAHAEGRVDRRSYVRERRRLIDGIVSGDIACQESRILPPEPEGAAPTSTLGEFDATIELKRPPNRRSRRTLMAWGIVLGIAISLIGVMLWLWLGLLPR